MGGGRRGWGRPDISAPSKRAAPTPSSGATATKRTTIPMPPSQRHREVDLLIRDVFDRPIGGRLSKTGRPETRRAQRDHHGGRNQEAFPRAIPVVQRERQRNQERQTEGQHD